VAVMARAVAATAMARENAGLAAEAAMALAREVAATGAAEAAAGEVGAAEPVVRPPGP
jgi:hypothetical protein